MEMLDQRPYLMNAIRDWIIDSNCTPYIMVVAANARVPAEHVKDGKIILNVRPAGVKNFFCTKDGISFSTRFGGRDYPVDIPLDNVIAIYAKENGSGMTFSDHRDIVVTAEQTAQPDQPKPPGKPGLKVVK